MGAEGEIAKRLCGVIEAFEILFTFHSIARVAHRRGCERRNRRGWRARKQSKKRRNVK